MLNETVYFLVYTFHTDKWNKTAWVAQKMSGTRDLVNMILEREKSTYPSRVATELPNREEYGWTFSLLRQKYPPPEASQ